MYLDWAILHYSFRRQKMIDKIKENWEKILLILKEEHEVSDVSYRTWLQPLSPYEFKGNTVTIIVPEQTFFQGFNFFWWFIGRYDNLLF